jgi:RimJ/RimL family protein N-acetyltransferase
MREAYLRRTSAQIVHDAWHRRGRTTIFPLVQDICPLDMVRWVVPQGSRMKRSKSFFLFPAHENEAGGLFQAFLAASQPKLLDAQTNDPYLWPLFQQFAHDHEVRANLFADGGLTQIHNPGVLLRQVTAKDQATVFEHTTEPVGDWGLERDGALVATGGMFFHYNAPYRDLYMEVAPQHRRQGFASYLLQELKRICYEGGHVPGARCDAENIASRRALEQAGMQVCGQLVSGRVKQGA